MFYDLNIPYSPNDAQLPRTLNFLHELGYNVAALNHVISGKLPKDLTCAIPNPLPFQKELPAKLEIRRRVTLVLTESIPSARLNELGQQYDVLALRPVDEKTLQLACMSYDCDIISIDLTQRLYYFFKFKMLSEAIRDGKRLEICYGQALLGDAQARRYLISNATQLIRATRGGRGLIISSEAKAAIGCRGPWDAINLAAIWGLGQERGYEAMSKECRSVVVTAQLKRTGYRGAINVVYGGEKPAQEEKTERTDHPAKGQGKQASNGQKRKADEALGAGQEVANAEEKPLSNTQLKKRAKLAAKAEAEAAAKAKAQLQITADGGAAVDAERVKSTKDGANEDG